MVTTHNLGFPRIGANRELKLALERHWQGLASQHELEGVGSQLRQQHWSVQASLDWAPVGDFSFYDQVLDMSFMLGNVPARALSHAGNSAGSSIDPSTDPSAEPSANRSLDQYFRLARGRSAHDSACSGVHAGEMTKWFDTNYHYIVPEFAVDSAFSLDASVLLAQLEQARAAGVRAKPVIIGPLTYLWLGKARDDSDKLALLPRLLPVYAALFERLAAEGVEWVQVDEPVLVTELSPAWQAAFRTATRRFRPTRSASC